MPTFILSAHRVDRQRQTGRSARSFTLHPVVCSSMSSPLPNVRGIDLDAQTRCTHYRTELDIVAIKMKCCGIYYACKDCHEVLADHQIELWPRSEWSQLAVLCGACGSELSIERYMASGDGCPHCDAAFNPGCRNHYQFYFTSAV